jgi:LytS/YehU family sensor histidine kinase
MNQRTTFWTVQLIGWSAFGINNYLTTAPDLLEFEKLPVFSIKVAFGALGFGFSSLLYALYVHLASRLQDTAKLVVLAVLACFFSGFAWHLVYRLALPPPFGGVQVIAQFTFFVEAVNNIVVLLAWSAAYFGLKFWHDSRIQEQAAVEAKALAKDAQLKALHYQLNPHFLFNALNSVRALTHEDRDRATEMVTQLAEFLRFALNGTPATETSLKNEIDALRKYLAIEQTRFEDKLVVAIDVERMAEDSIVPGLLVHPLLENAIKHGMRTSPMPLQVRLRACLEDGRLVIEVANTGELAEPDPTQQSQPADMGIGLQNVRDRLAHSYPDRHEFEVFQDGDWVRAIISIDQHSGWRDGKRA